MAGILEYFKAFKSGGQGGFSDFLRGAAKSIDQAEAVRDAAEAFTDEKSQSFLVRVLLPWIGGVAVAASQRWSLPARVRRCIFSHTTGCTSAPVALCFGCSRPICMNHAFVAADATIVCWECVRVGASAVSSPGPTKKKNGGSAARSEKDAEWAYRVLRVSPDASDEEIKAAYKAQCVKWHPDRAKNPSDARGHEEMFKTIQLAMDAVKKARGACIS